MLLRIGIVCIVAFIGSCFIARHLALRKNRRPAVIIAIGFTLGVIAFAGLWTLGLVYGNPIRIAAAVVLAVMPAATALMVPANRNSNHERL
jgi:hypothetical protein